MKARRTAARRASTRHPGRVHWLDYNIAGIAARRQKMLWQDATGADRRCGWAWASLAEEIPATLQAER